MDAAEIRKMLDRRWHEHEMKHLDEQDEKNAQTKKIRKMLDDRWNAKIRKRLDRD